MAASSRSSAPDSSPRERKTLIQKKILAKYGHFPSKLAGHLSRKYLFLLDPVKLQEPQDVRPGVFCFIQQKADPKYLYLFHLVDYLSQHYWLATQAGLSDNPDKLLSAGEAVVDWQGKPLAWSFQTGKYCESLGLMNITDELLDAVSLPKERFFSFKEWRELSDRCFQHFFTETGRYRVIVKTGPLFNAEDEVIETNKAKRNAIEEAMLGAIENPRVRNFFLSIKDSRDKVEIAETKRLEENIGLIRNVSSNNLSRETTGSNTPDNNSRALRIDIKKIERSNASSPQTPMVPSVASTLVELTREASESKEPEQPISGVECESPIFMLTPPVAVLLQPSLPNEAVAVNPVSPSSFFAPSQIKSQSPKMPNNRSLRGKNKVAQVPEDGQVDAEVAATGCCFSFRKFFS